MKETERPADGAVAAWMLVPVEPTPEMIEAGVHQFIDAGHTANRQGTDAVYRAMIAAAPQGAAAPAGTPDIDYCEAYIAELLDGKIVDPEVRRLIAWARASIERAPGGVDAQWIERASELANKRAHFYTGTQPWAEYDAEFRLHLSTAATGAKK